LRDLLDQIEEPMLAYFLPVVAPACNFTDSTVPASKELGINGMAFASLGKH
jgi:hypothetical protein